MTEATEPTIHPSDEATPGPRRISEVNGRWARSAFAGVARWGTIVALGALIVLFTALSPGAFATVSNLKVVLDNAAVLVLLATGLTVCLAMTNFDLSIAALGSLSVTGTAALIVTAHVAPWAAVLIVLAGGIFVGASNGLIVTSIQVSALVITLGTASVLEGINMWISGGQTIFGNMPHYFLALGQGSVFGVPAPVVIAGGAALILWFLMTWTEVGRGMAAIGGNREAARLSGIAVRRLQIYGFIIASVTAVVAGIVLTSQASSGYPSAADSDLLLAYAAAFLGSVTLRRNEFHIVGTVIGALLLGVTSDGLTILNLPAFISDIFSGGVLIVAVVIPALETRRG